MDNKQKLINAIGLAIRANNYVYGQRLLEYIRDGKVKLVICTKDMGSSQHKKVMDKCNSFNVECLDGLVTIEELNKIVNTKNQISAIGITDENIKQLIKSYI